MKCGSTPPVRMTVAPPATHKPPKTTEAPHTVHTVAPPPNPLTCSASMSDSTPADGHDTDVIVNTKVSGASVTATAHYKTTTHTKSAVAGSGGTAEITFAEPGIQAYVFTFG